jgi:hypothetical protein
MTFCMSAAARKWGHDRFFIVYKRTCRWRIPAAYKAVGPGVEKALENTLWPRSRCYCECAYAYDAAIPSTSTHQSGPRGR